MTYGYGTRNMCVFSGDFGGYLGLLLGGSAMSLFEVLDLLIYNGFVKLTTRKAKPPVTNGPTAQNDQDSNLSDGVIIEHL